MSAPHVVKEFSLEEEYKKKTGITPNDTKKLREWLQTQPHLPGEYITDLDLILTYHCCDRSTEVSKQVLDLHFTLRNLFSNFFKDRYVDDKVMKTLTVVLPLFLDSRSHQDDMLFYCRLVDYDVKNYVFSDSVKVALMMIDLYQLETGTWPGLQILFDMDRVTLGHLARLDLQTLQQFLYYLQEAMLLKVKAIHFLNAPSFMDKLMMMLRPFLKRSFLEMIVIHQVGANTPEKYFPMDALPIDAGGKFKSFQQASEDIIERMKLNADFFASENKKRVVEARRPGKPKTITDIFGSIDGSFKKLDID